jgi:hypothetical protein
LGILSEVKYVGFIFTSRMNSENLGSYISAIEEFVNSEILGSKFPNLLFLGRSQILDL